MKKTVFINTRGAEENSSALFRYVDSDRSDGKTTTMIRMCYDNAKNDGRAGLIIRRYKGEASKAYAETLCTNLKKVRECNDLTCKGSPEKNGVLIKEGNLTIARIVPLSRIDPIKSSVDIADYKDMYFDEYVPISGRYLPDEVTKILETYSTIDRRTQTTVAWFFSNHPTNINPVFMYFGVEPRVGLSLWKKGRFLLLRVANKGNARQIQESPFGELIAGTPYEDYITGGTIVTREHLIAKTPLRGRLPFVLRTPVTSIAIYYTDDAYTLVLRAVPPRVTDCAIYTTYPDVGKNNGVFIGQNRGLLNAMRERFQCGKLLFYDGDTLQKSESLIKLLAQ